MKSCYASSTESTARSISSLTDNCQTRCTPLLRIITLINTLQVKIPAKQPSIALLSNVKSVRGDASSVSQRQHEKTLTTSFAFGEKPLLGLLRLKISSLVESKPIPIALFLVLTVLTLALNSKVMSTAMSVQRHERRTAVNKPTRHQLLRHHPATLWLFPDGEEILRFYLEVLSVIVVFTAFGVFCPANV